MQSFKNNRYQTVRGVALTICSQYGKSDKNDLTIISKSYSHCHNMKKTHAKFQNDWYKTVREVALTRGTQSIY